MQKTCLVGKTALLRGFQSIGGGDLGRIQRNTAFLGGWPCHEWPKTHSKSKLQRLGWKYWDEITMNRNLRYWRSVWEKAGWFIGRPAVAFSGLCLIILINALVVVFNKQSNTVANAEQVVHNTTDEFPYTVATIYDFENVQP